MMRIVSKTSLCSSLALATALLVGAKPAAAQVAGDLNSAGGATITGGGASVVLNAPQTTIEWTATGTPVSGVRDFLPAGNTMAFSSGSDFAVLNRVSSGTDMVGLNGTITSTVNGSKGGTVFFYNPNGIVVGGTATIDVGSLGLTTSDPGSGNSWFSDFNGASPTLTFSGVSDGTSQIDIKPGAQISSNGTNSFIAMVAPKISTAGTIKTDGDVALVAAEAATLTFSGAYDLYSIQVDVGTDVTDSLNVTGGSIGRNSAVETSGVARRAYLVTVPKNDATTLLISGGASLGFDVADSAVVEGNSIVLSAGRDTSLGDEVDGGQIAIGQSTFGSSVDAFATDQITIGSDSGDIHFLTDAEFRASIGIGIAALGGDVTFDGNLLADTSEYSSPGESATGGLITLSASNEHRLTVLGTADLDASGQGGYQFETGVNGGDGTGGNISVTADGGQMDFGSLNAWANGYGGAVGSDATGGNGQGGTIEVAATGGGSIVASYASLVANAEGGSTVECYSCGISGGTGHGGTVTLRAADSGSQIAFGATDVEAEAEGGAGDVLAGIGQGGDLFITLTGLVNVDLGEFGDFSAAGEGGYGLMDAIGGNGTGGRIELTMSKADLDRPALTVGDLTLDAGGVGGTSMNGGAGGVGTGGIATAAIDGGDVDAWQIYIGAAGRGGDSWNSVAGDAHGGDASMSLTDATVDVQGVLHIDGSAALPFSEGDPAFGNNAFGGQASISAVGSAISTNLSGDYALDSLWVDASATAASGSAGDGGYALAGTATGDFSGSTITAGEVVFDARGTGGDAYSTWGGYGEGGTVDVSMVDTSVTGQTFSLFAYGEGGDGAGRGGQGVGGSVGLSSDGSDVTLSGAFRANANGDGGLGSDDGALGGTGLGGTVALGLTSTAVSATNFNAFAEGFGGGNYAGASGGTGDGGTATVELLGGSDVTANQVVVLAGGYGGENSQECNDCGTIGGDGFGGSASLILSGGGNSLAASVELSIYGSGVGGAGDGGGGSGQGDFASLQILDDSSLTLGNVYIFADGVGGDAYVDGNGGDGTAGTAQLFSANAAGATIVHHGPAYFHVTAEGFGGDAENGAGGNATANNASFIADGLSFDSDTSLYVSSMALGGNSAGGTGGSATGGAAQVILANNTSATMAQALEVRSYAVGGNGSAGESATAGGIDVLVDNSSLNSGTGLATGGLGVILSGWATGGDGSVGDGGDAAANSVALRVTNGGSVNSTSAHLSSYAEGGDSVGGTRAGNADAGASQIEVTADGSLDLTGNAMIKADALGGVGSAGADGGDAAADSFALLNVLGGGSASIGGDLTMTVNRTGGDGLNGGDALAIIDYQTPTVGETSPVAEILSQGGSVSVGGLTTMTADSVGGRGDLGGAGGAAYGGTVSIRALNSAVQPSSVDLGDLVMSATATAGDGGQGVSSDVGDGGNGGRGGDALGGMIFIQAMSLDGQISAGNTTLSTDAMAGNGGGGGSGINGGNGADGGAVATNWSAGAIQISVPSGGDPAGLPLVTEGFIHLGDINATTSATGGDGGWAGYAYNGSDGVAGNGGYAQSGDLYIFNRGGDLSGGNLAWAFDANGGAAGANANESAAGVGGSASIGEFILVNTNRSGQPDQRGTMSFGDINAVGTSTGGYGLVNGSSLYTSSLDFETTNSDTHLGSLTYLANATDGPALEGYDLSSLILVQNGTAQIDGALTVSVPATMAVWLENGTLGAASVDLSASDFFHHDGPAPTVLGTIDTGSLAVTTGNDIVIDANLDITASYLDLNAPGSVDIGSATSAGQISIYADSGFILSNDLDAVGNIWLTAAGDIRTQGLAATGNAYVEGNAVTIGGATDAGGDVTLYASNALSTAGIASGGDVSLYGNGIVVGGPTSAIGSVGMTSTLSLVAGDVSSSGDMTLAAAGNLTAGSLYSDTGIIDGFAGQALSIADATSGSDLYLEASAGDLSIAGDSFALGGMELSAGGLAATANLTAQATISVIGGAIDVGDVFAGADLGGGVGALALIPGADIALWSGDGIDAGDLFATARIGIAAPGAIATGTIEAGDLAMILGGAGIATGSIAAGGELFIAGFDMFALGYDPLNEDFDPAPVLALSPTATGGNVAIAGAIDATQVRANAGGAFSSGAVTASDGPISILAGGSVAVGALAAPGPIDVTAQGGSLSAGHAGSSGGTLLLAASGAINAGNLSAYGDISVDGDNGIAIGTATSQAGSVALRSVGGAVATGAVTGAAIDILAGGDVTATGALVSADSVTVDAGGNIALGSASGTNSVELFGNAVQVGALDTAYAYVDAAGLLSVNGAWTADFAELRSNDIEIGANGSISGSVADLRSTNAIGAGLGDGSGAVQGSYLLSNAEFGRIQSDSVLVHAEVSSAPIDLLIGDLALAGGGRYFDFGVVDGEGFAGRLRVVGQVEGQDFTNADRMDLDAQLVEVEAVGGGIDFSPGSDAVLGSLGIAAQRFHVAEASVLDKLAADTQYAGRDQDLATAPAATHSATTINVNTIDLYLSDGSGIGGLAVPAATAPYSIYVQNMSSSGVRSGLLIADANLYGDLAPGSVDMIINGSWVTDQGTLSGAAVRDAFVADPDNDLTLFTASSSMNGCALAGGACFTPEPPPPPPPPPPPAPQVEDLANQFMFLDTSIGDQLGFGDSLEGAGASEGDDEEDSQTEDKNAIDPPPTVINGKPLDPQTPTDEPVSGSGNPALIGAGSNQQEQQ